MVDVEQSEIWKREVGKFRSEYQVHLEEEAWHAARELVWEGAMSKKHRELVIDLTQQWIRGVVRSASRDKQVLILWAGGSSPTTMTAFVA